MNDELMNSDEIVSALVDIIRENVEEIARTIERWGIKSKEVDKLLKECLIAAENDAAISARNAKINN